MFWNSPGFPFVRLLERTYPEIRAEAERLSVADFADWPLREAYRGSWKIFCILSRDPGWVMAPTCPENARRCPRTRAILERIPGVVRAGFSLLLPGTQIHLHADERDDSLLASRFGDLRAGAVRYRVAEREQHTARREVQESPPSVHRGVDRGTNHPCANAATPR